MAPRKPKKSEPTPPNIQGVDWNGSLADFKQATVGNVKPGGTKMPTGNKGPDTGMFAGSGTPLNSSIGMTDTSRKNVTNVIKNLAIQEIGGAAIAKGLQLGVKAAINTGIPARVSNMVKGEIVVVHGSPTQGLKVINPTQGLNRRGTRAVDLGKQGFFEIPKPNTVNQGGNIAKNYALPDKLGNVPEGKVGGGSIYIAKTKKTGLVQEGYIGYTPNPSPVVSEIRLSDIPEKNIQSYFDKYETAIKQAGGPQLPRAIKKEIKTFQKQQSKIFKNK
jgi:hypothetical protein